MAFRYRLQSVLRLRRSQEHQEEQRLLALTAKVNGLRSELEARQRADMTSRRAALAEMEAWCFGAQLEFRSWCETASQRAIELLRGRLHEAERKRLEQLKVYQEARQQREVFESLRESQREVYERELARRQQQAADEAFLMRTLEAPRD